jgi:3-isopropylmalate/(R)-2-methylmalate dehydratase small subunit
MSERFPIFKGVAAPLLKNNVDAMTIAPRTPAEKGGAKTQGGAETVRAQDLFAHMRFLDDGQENPEFVLNRPEFRTAKFLVTGRNFGCGSAREHSVWALCAFGIGCIVAPSFGPLFYGNCFKNRLVPVELDESTTHAIAAECGPGAPDMTLDLESRQIQTPAGRRISFSLPAFRYRQLLEGLDEIDMTLQAKSAIDEYQRRETAARPWLFASAHRDS